MTVLFSISRGVRDSEGKLLSSFSAGVFPDKLGKILDFEPSKDGAITLFDRNGRAVYRYPSVEWSWEDRLLDRKPGIQDALEGREVLGTFPSLTT